jgi:hypothetical protein
VAGGSRAAGALGVSASRRSLPAVVDVVTRTCGPDGWTGMFGAPWSIDAGEICVCDEAWEPMGGRQGNGGERRVLLDGRFKF